MKLQFNVKNRTQPDPYVFEDGGKFYMFVTAINGVEAYTADDLFGEWAFQGTVCTVEGCKEYWAPCIIKTNGKYYLYFSCGNENMFQWLHVAEADTPLGPYTKQKALFDRFSIDAHVVETKDGLFLFYAEDNRDVERFGTRVFVDKLLDPFTPANRRREIIVPDFDEEIFMRNREGDGRDWHTIEGAFWFMEDGWQYVIYSGGCYENDTYHIGYAAAKSTETDLVKVDFVKHTDGGKFDPVLIKNEVEEGTGHHSVVKYKGEYYAVYHGRDVKTAENEGYVEERTARICKLLVKDGVITAERM